MHRRTLKRFAACVGIVVAAIAAHPASAADVAPLKFMTFNIWGDYFGNPVGEREAGVEATILKEPCGDRPPR